MKFMTRGCGVAVAWMSLAAGLVLFGCKDGGSDSNDSPSTGSETGPDTGAISSTATDTGTDVVDDDDDDGDDDAILGTGSVALAVTPISSDPVFASVEAERAESFPPGTLALPSGSELRNSPRVFNLLPDPAPVFNPEWIASGPPLGVKLIIKKITLVPKASSEDEQLPGKIVFEDDAGVTIALDSGVVDLTQMLTAIGAETGAPVKFAVDVGTYDEVQITYRRAGEVRGCVSASFKDATGTRRTFCTKAGKSVFETTDSVDVDFEKTGEANPEGEWMQLDLDKSGVGTATANDEFAIGYPLDTPLSVTEGSTVTLSLVVDLNRLLRYHRANAGIGPNPEFPEDSAYFFTTLFAESLYVFVGPPGRIYGYEGVVEACKTVDWDAANKSCTAQLKTVAFWMTFVTDADGNALLFNAMPDDDNVLTITKGSSFGEPEFLTAAEMGGINVKFSLGDDDGGTFKNFPASLDADAVGEVVDGVELESNHTSGDVYHGMPVVTRRL